MPGEKQAPNEKEQLRWLLEKFTGHQAFHRLRGKLNRAVIDCMLDVAPKGSSRRESQGKFRQFADDLIILQSIIAQLERDEWGYALRQLKLALANLGYLFPEETIPIDQTAEMLLIIPNFEQTLEVIRWVNKYGHYDGQKLINRETFLPLLSILPSLEKILQERTKEFGETITQYEVSLRSACIKDIDLPKRPNIAIGKDGFLRPRQKATFGYFYYGWLIAIERQKDFLKQIPRQDQDKLFTWHLQVPAGSLENKLNKLKEAVFVGFHPSEDHPKWEKSYPSLVSKETTSGWGTIFFLHEEMAGGYPEENLLCSII